MSVRDMSCLFCRTIAGELDSSRVYEDERAVAFLDIQPATPGHLLVAPRTHADGLAELSVEDGAHLFRVAHRLALALRRSDVPCEGVNLFLADGAAAFQEVFHVHLHVLPRTVDDGFRIEAAWQRPDRADLDRIADSIRSGVDALRDC